MMASPPGQHPFITNYNSDEMDRLVFRASEGVRSNKIRPIDYEKLKAMATEKKFSAHKSLLKVKKFEQLSKQNKENHLIKQHKLVWQKEFLHLNGLRKKLQGEIEGHMRQNVNDGGICSKIYQEFEDYKASLESDFGQFKQSTTEPIWNLREDLQFWLQENMADLRLGSPDTVQKHTEIRQTVESVTTQQEHVLDKLKNEEHCLEEELQLGEYGNWGFGNLEKRPHLDQGIPEEAFDLECPDDELKVSVLQEFIHIDQKYLELLNKLEDSHAITLSFDRYGGWTPEEHAIFVLVVEQYQHDIHNRRALILDRLKRQLPLMSRLELISHESWWDSYRFFHLRSKAIIQDWQRDRRELLHKASVVFMEATIAHEIEEVKQEYLKKHQELRKTLYDKVCHWREQKMEAMWLKAEMEEKRQEEVQRRLKSAENKEKKRRDEERSRVQKFQAERERKLQQEEEEKRQRLEALTRALEEQMKFDKERVRYREEQLEKKLEERRIREVEKEEEELEKEARLEALREKVRVIAESNPARVLQETEAWNAHLLGDEDDVNLQKPLFDVHGFTAKQVTADPRFRLEQKLREAGLHNTDYARHVLKSVPPQHAPRRDMESNVFK